MNNNSVPQNKSAPTATLLIYKKLIFEISAVFYICVSSFNFGSLALFGKLRNLCNVM